MLSNDQVWNLLSVAAMANEDTHHTWEPPCVAGRHPLRPSLLVDYCGSPGVSASARVLMSAVMQEMLISPGLLIARPMLYMVPAEGTNGYDYLAEVRVVASNPAYAKEWSESIFICSGITDYSGEGNAARVRLTTWMEALVALGYPQITDIERLPMTPAQYNACLRQHSDLIVQANSELSAAPE